MFSGLMSRWTMPLACAARERRCGLRGDPQDALLGQLGLAREALGERLALEELHHDERAAVVGVAEVGDVDDVLVADRRRELRLLLEARDDRFALRVLLEQDLDRDALADQRVRRLVDRAHAALADLARDEVATRQRRRRSSSAARLRRAAGVPARGVSVPLRSRASTLGRVLRGHRDRGVVAPIECRSRHRASARPALGVSAAGRPGDDPPPGLSPEPVDIRPHLDGRGAAEPSQTRPALSPCRNSSSLPTCRQTANLAFIRMMEYIDHRAGRTR